MKARHSEKEDDDYEQGGEESDVKTTKRYDFFGHFNCHKCGQEFGTRESLERHIMQKERNKKNHSLFEQFECVHCVKVFPTQEALDNHVHQMHQIRQKDLEICKSTITFKHPFTMIVAGPTRSGKTTWVAKLIQNRLRQIKPTPSRILWCYMHWQPMYTNLKKLMPEIIWGDALPTEETFSSYSNSLVILDDMMDDVVSDSSMMKVFTERSHHQNISVIFMTQNIFHQGKAARTISLNTQYMVLFENARDRQQIKTLAKQMYPEDWSSFVARFKKETRKPYGRMIIDLRPGVADKDRVLTDDDCPKVPMAVMEQDKRVNCTKLVRVPSVTKQISNIKFLNCH